MVDALLTVNSTAAVPNDMGVSGVDRGVKYTTSKGVFRALLVYISNQPHTTSHNVIVNDKP